MKLSSAEKPLLLIAKRNGRSPVFRKWFIAQSKYMGNQFDREI